VSKDIIQRWTFPLVPDNNLLGHTSYQYSRRNVYKETKDVNFARSCVIGENSVIGGGTSIGHNTRIDHSVIGPNCVIGTNSLLPCYSMHHITH
jgi:translation initiation factor eIF-2B subunit epsilon